MRLRIAGAKRLLGLDYGGERKAYAFASKQRMKESAAYLKRIRADQEWIDLFNDIVTYCNTNGIK